MIFGSKQNTLAEVEVQPAAVEVESTMANAQDALLDNVTTISRATTILGDITSEDNVEIFGTVTGNVSARQSLRISGKLVGDAKAGRMILNDASVQGDLECTGDVSIDTGSIVYGHIVGESILLNGKVKGNIVVQQNAVLQESAVVLGDIQAASLSMAQGAKLEGQLRIVIDKSCKDMFDKMPLGLEEHRASARPEQSAATSYVADEQQEPQTIG